MELKKLTDRIFYCPHDADTDRPLLAYVRGDKYALFLGDSACEDVYNGGYLDRAKLRMLTQTVRKTACSLCVLSHEPPLTKEEFLASAEEELQ